MQPREETSLSQARAARHTSRQLRMYELVLKRLKQWLCMYPCGYTRRAMNDDLPPRRYVPAVQSASRGDNLAVCESFTPAPLPRLAFEDGESRFMDMSEVVKTDTAQAIFEKMLEVRRTWTTLPNAPHGSPARLDFLVGYERFFEELGFDKRSLFHPGWKGTLKLNLLAGLRTTRTGYGSTLAPSNIRQEFGKAARIALQIMQGRCACRHGRAGGCRDIGSALGYSCRGVVHLNHTQDNKTKSPSKLFDLSDPFDFDAFKSEVATLEARVTWCHSMSGTAATSAADHRRLDQQPLLIDAVIRANPNPGPPRTVSNVIDLLCTVHRLDGTLLFRGDVITLHNILCSARPQGFRGRHNTPVFSFEELERILETGFGVAPEAVFPGYPSDPGSFKQEYQTAFRTPVLWHAWRSKFTRKLICTLVVFCSGYEARGCRFRIDALPCCRMQGIDLDHTVPRHAAGGRLPNVIFRFSIDRNDAVLMREIRSLQPLCGCCHQRGKPLTIDRPQTWL